MKTWTKHIESTSNGLGAQSMWLFVMACRRQIPATVSLTADTGWEEDRTWSNGRVGSAREYFDEVVKPFGDKHGLDTRMVRTRNKQGVQLVGLRAYMEEMHSQGLLRKRNPIPMFGSKGGRRTQTCTDKFKIRALKQELRRMGAKTNCNAQGIHVDEALRRMSGRWLRQDGKWNIYQTQVQVKNENGEKEFVDVKWMTHYYPLVDLGFNRAKCRALIEAENIPFIISTECDGCPHKDLDRWERTAAPVLADLVKLEKQFDGAFFFTDKRIPLLDAIQQMQNERQAKGADLAEVDFGCDNAICGI